MERRLPGFLAMQAKTRRDTEDRRRREEAWWQEVLAMQAAGRVDEAAQLTQANAEELGRFVLDLYERIAMLYAREVDRRLALHDRPGAEAAAREAVRWMSVWASGSTSGGEGTARSRAMADMDKELQRKLAGSRVARMVCDRRLCLSAGLVVVDCADQPAPCAARSAGTLHSVRI